MSERVDLVAAGEVDVADLVDHVAQQVAVDHPVDRAFEDRGDNVAPVATVGTLQAPQICKQTRSLLAIRSDSFFVVHEAYQLVARDAILFAAQSRQRYGDSRAGRKRLPAIRASCSAICSMSSRNLRNMIQVSIGRRSRSPMSPLSLRHNVAAGLDDG